MPDQPEQWWAVVDGDGELVSLGTVVADPLPEGLTAIETVEPQPGQVWDAGEQGWVTPPPPPEPPNPAAVLLELSAVAKGPGGIDAKLAAIIGILAAVPEVE